jgi:hypothetical protein
MGSSPGLDKHQLCAPTSVVSVVAPVEPEHRLSKSRCPAWPGPASGEGLAGLGSAERWTWVFMSPGPGMGDCRGERKTPLRCTR